MPVLGIHLLGVERLVLGSDGYLKVHSGTWGGIERTNTTVSIWSNKSV